MAENVAYLAREHPVRVLLEAAALGHEPTRADLDNLARDDLPEGHDLTRFRAQVAQAGAAIAQAYSPEPGTVYYGTSRAMADDHVARLALQMTPAERELAGDDPATVESVQDIAARIFGR